GEPRRAVVDPAAHPARQGPAVPQVRAVLRCGLGTDPHRAWRGDCERADIARRGLGLAHAARAGPGGEGASAEAGAAASETGLRRRTTRPGAGPGEIGRAHV